jgi:CRP-like cAMP-binding protein
LLHVFVRTQVCRYLDDSQAQLVLEHGSLKRLRQGEKLFSAGDTGESMYVILQGTINVHQTLDGGQKQTLADLRFGDVIGEFGLVDREPRTAHAEASEESALFELTREQLIHIARTDPTLGIKVLWAIMETMTLKFRASLHGYQSLLSQLAGKRPEMPKAEL